MTEIEANAEIEDRDSILKKLEQAIEIAHTKIIRGRVKNKNTEKIKQAWIKVLAQCANVYLVGLKDREIEELKIRIERIEQKQREREYDHSTTD